jgi:hypothetical protein
VKSYNRLYCAEPHLPARAVGGKSGFFLVTHGMMAEAISCGVDGGGNVSSGAACGDVASAASLTCASGASAGMRRAGWAVVGCENGLYNLLTDDPPCSVRMSRDRRCVGKYIPETRRDGYLA